MVRMCKWKTAAGECESRAVLIKKIINCTQEIKMAKLCSASEHRFYEMLQVN